MNVKKAIKRIGALAAGTAMVSATIVGAMAYDLSDYPSPFVEDGQFEGKLVVGRNAKVSDVLGAIDIAASLQAASVEEVSVDGTSGTVSVSGGVQVKESSTNFLFGDALDDFNAGVYDDDDFEDLLADGIVEDDDGTEYEYEQTITVPDSALIYDQDDDYGDDPVFALDFNSGDYIIFRVEMKDTLDVTELTDSESIDMFGRTYTFDPGHSAGDDLTLYGSDVTVIVSQDEPLTVEVGGEEYTIEVLGGNSDQSTVNLRVTGDGTDTKSLTDGDSRTMAGLELFVDDVFISNIGDDSISVSLFVGSNKIVIPDTAVSTTESYQEIEINGEDETDIEAWVDGSDIDAIDNIYFRIDPTDFQNDAIDDEWNWLVMGEEFEDPLFDFSVAFTSFTPGISGREMVELARSGDTYSIAFQNANGDEYDLELYQSPSTSVALGDDLLLGESEIADDEIFIVEDTDATNDGDSVTYIFEVRDIDDTAGSEKVTLKDLGTGATQDIDHLDEIEDTGVYVYVRGSVFDLVNKTGAGAVDDNVTSATRLVTDGGLIVTLDTTLGDGANLTMSEDSDDLDDAAAAVDLEFAIIHDADDDIAMTSAAWSAGGDTATDTDGDVLYGISDYGTWFEQERDNSGDYLRVYYSEQETNFNVFLNGPDAVVVTTGGSSGGNAYTVNEFVVGSIAVYDDEASSLVGRTPLIVVGGPCVNVVAMELMGNPEVCFEGFTQGKGKIKLFESQNALLVAGYSGEDTTGAAYVLADWDNPKYNLMGDEVEVIVTDLERLEVRSVA